MPTSRMKAKNALKGHIEPYNSIRALGSQNFPMATTYTEKGKTDDGW